MLMLRTLICCVIAGRLCGAQSSAHAVQLVRSGDWRAAKTAAAAALQRDAQDSQAYYVLGRVALVELDPGRACEQLDRAVRLDGGVSEYHLWYGKAIGQLSARSSKPEMPFLGRKAKAEIERAVALDSLNVDARDAMIDVAVLAPAWLGGDPVRARREAQALIRLSPMRGHSALGRLAARDGDGEAVEREYTSAIAAAPDSVRPYAALASWYVAAQSWDRAFAIWERYLRVRPDEVVGGQGIGRVAAASGRQLVRGERGLRAFLTTPPADVGPSVLSRTYLWLGEILNQTGRANEARAAFEQAIQLDNHNDDARRALR